MSQHHLVKEILFNEETIQKRIQELAKTIDQEYRKTEKPLILVGILKGSINFLVDLMKYMTIDTAIDFMYVKSYDGKLEGGEPQILIDLLSNVHNRDILIVEDIIDSGATLIKLMEHLKSKEPKSVKIITFLDKKIKRKFPINADWVGFEVPDHFLVGYGLDYDETLRNLPYVGIFNISMINDVK